MLRLEAAARSAIKMTYLGAFGSALALALDSLTHSLAHWLTRSLTHWLTRSLAHSLTGSLAHWLIIYVLVCAISCDLDRDVFR